jgi:hypothetical protein
MSHASKYEFKRNSINEMSKQELLKEIEELLHQISEYKTMISELEIHVHHLEPNSKKRLFIKEISDLK